jgi:hypothetical protein
VIIVCTALTLICETSCADRPNVAIDAAPLAHPGDGVKVPVLVDPVIVQLPKVALNTPVPLLNVPVPPLKTPPTTVQLDTPQLSVPPPGNGKED